jgi:prefoldin subunit 5
VQIVKHIHIILSLIILSSLVFTACDFEFLSDPCASDPESHHCYQNLAVERADPSLCAKISAPEGFDKSNPPKDKCYLMVAQSTGDATVCNNIIGGEFSYEKSNCIVDVAVAQKDFSACDMLSGKQKDSCYESIGSSLNTNDLLNLNDEIAQLEKDLIYDWKNENLKNRLAELKNQQDLLYKNANPDVQRDFFRNQREKILEGIDDPQLKSMIAKDYSSYRSKHENADVTQLLEAMNEIKKEKQTIQRLDQEANKLVDDLKNNIIDYGSDKAKEAVDDVTGAAWEWSFSKGSNEMKYKISQLEEMKNKYDKASAQYKAISEQIDKFKKVYDEVNEVYKKVNEINGLVANGKIDEGKAEVLKGAVYLGKGLEYATGYVPVFGSTMSTISKETFDATVKFATKRAQRTTSLQRCIDDPLNCDTDGITGY